jgi:energy-coupling factor transporter transmembrane protein EcfT
MKRLSSLLPTYHAHSAALMVSWICLTLMVQMLNAALLWVGAGCLLFCVGKFAPLRFVTLLRRTRWIFFSLLLIYAYTTPGEAIFVQLDVYSPTREGLLDGLLQLTRLVCSLAGLAILLTRLTQTQLIEGLFVLLAPLQKIGFPRERVAVRLALTLRYAESAMSDTVRDWRGSIENLLAPVEIELSHITLARTPMRRLDVLLMSLCVLCVMGVWL